MGYPDCAEDRRIDMEDPRGDAALPAIQGWTGRRAADARAVRQQTAADA
jgi:hypothetical protein